MIKTFYYYYHLFYKTIFKDNDSYFTARLAITASESLLLISVFDISSAYFLCQPMNKYIMAAITLILLSINTLFFFDSEKTKNIEKNKPKFFNSHNLSIAITLIFFLITTSSMFWLGYVVQNIIDNCH
jgi:hypothetical membrane protein